MTVQITNPERVGMSSDRLARIAPAIRKWVDRGTLPGVDMMISRRGQIVYSAQVGSLSPGGEEPLPADALYRIFSMTKTIVCTALMTLYEEGKFQLMTPLAAVLPAFSKVKVASVDEQGQMTEVNAQRPITIGQCMQHTAGFTYGFLEDSPVCNLYREVELGQRGDRTLSEFIDELSRLPLAFQPGTRWHYSVGIDVAAAVIERLADMPLRDFLKTRILDPLGMVDTDFYIPEPQRHRLMTMTGEGNLMVETMSEIIAAWNAGRHEIIDVSNSYPVDKPDQFQRGGHGLYATTQDYMRFAQMLLNGGELDGQRIIGRKTLELMHTNHIPHTMLPYELAGLPNPGYGFGLGSRVLLDVGLAGIPGSVGSYGWAGAAKTYYWVDPVEELIGVFMSQYQGINAPQLDFRVLAYQAIID